MLTAFTGEIEGYSLSNGYTREGRITTRLAHLSNRNRDFPRIPSAMSFLNQSSSVSAMATRSQRQRGPSGTLSSLDAAIEGVNLAKEISNIAPVKTAFALVSSLLTTIRVRFSLFRDEMFQSYE
jgi:hypothetical protein